VYVDRWTGENKETDGGKEKKGERRNEINEAGRKMWK
jgi:hypothetical protein